MASSSGVETAPPTAKSNTVETMEESSAVEMSELKTSNAGEDTSESKREEDTTAGAEQQQHEEVSRLSTPPPAATDPTANTERLSPPRPTQPARAASEALGPATDAPITTPPPSTAGPCLSITLMLTTGARHPYKIDEKYLKNRKVEAKNTEGSFDPREITAYKLKELIWTDWRQEWEPRPASPSSIRLIILGRLMEDNAALKDFPFKLDDLNTVHMTVKPADFLEDDDTGGKKGHSRLDRDGEDGRDAGCCRCVIL